MKQNSLQYLLDKYREGTLTEEERMELEHLSHRDEVMLAAHSQARGIVRRRMSLAVAAVMVVGAGVVALQPRDAQGGPMVAEAKIVPAQAVETPHEVSPAEEAALPETVKETPHATQTERAILPRPTTRQKAKKEEPSDPVVVCNNQCDAESVIDDIKRFLSV